MALVPVVVTLWPSEMAAIIGTPEAWHSRYEVLGAAWHRSCPASYKGARKRWLDAGQRLAVPTTATATAAPPAAAPLYPSAMAKLFAQYSALGRENEARAVAALMSRGFSGTLHRNVAVQWHSDADAGVSSATPSATPPATPSAADRAEMWRRAKEARARERAQRATASASTSTSTPQEEEFKARFVREVPTFSDMLAATGACTALMLHREQALALADAVTCARPYQFSGELDAVSDSVDADGKRGFMEFKLRCGPLAPHPPAGDVAQVFAYLMMTKYDYGLLVEHQLGTEDTLDRETRIDRDDAAWARDYLPHVETFVCDVRRCMRGAPEDEALRQAVLAARERRHVPPPIAQPLSLSIPATDLENTVADEECSAPSRPAKRPKTKSCEGRQGREGRDGTLVPAVLVRSKPIASANLSL